jgi:hypothetical protein
MSDFLTTLLARFAAALLEDLLVRLAHALFSGARRPAEAG